MGVASLGGGFRPAVSRSRSLKNYQRSRPRQGYTQFVPDNLFFPDNCNIIFERKQSW
jgi:hypothetical protein